jgi:hypothetical protein
MEEVRSHALMMTGRVMLGMIIAEVLTAWSPVDDELALPFAAL